MRFPTVWLFLVVTFVFSWRAGPSPAQVGPPETLPLDSTGPTTPLPRAEVDRRVADVLGQVYREGADYYNSNYHTEAAYLFRGALLTVEPMLEHRPQLQQELRRRLAKAMEPRDNKVRAYALQVILGDVRQRVAAKEVVDFSGGKTLWDRLGGEENVRRIIDEWIDAALKDPDVNFTRNGRYPMTAGKLAAMKDQLVKMASFASGGPYLVIPKRTMASIHEGMNITESEYEAFIGRLRWALLSNHVKSKDAESILEKLDFARKGVLSPGKVAQATKSENEGPGRAERGGNGQPVARAAPAAKLWDRLGGEEKVTKIIDEWISTALTDKRVNLTRNGQYLQDPDKIRQLKRQLVHVASSVSEGPYQYDGARLRTIHKGMQITRAEFDAFADLLEEAMQNNQVSRADQDVILGALNQFRSHLVRETAGQPAQSSGGTVGRAVGAVVQGVFDLLP